MTQRFNLWRQNVKRTSDIYAASSCVQHFASSALGVFLTFITLIMSNSGSESEFSDEEQGAQTFSIQPYQFEPRVNTDERDINTESLSGDKSMEGSEELNPRLENSDWYVLCSLLHCNSFTDLRNKLLFGPDVVFIIVSFSFFFVLRPLST